MSLKPKGCGVGYPSFVPGVGDGDIGEIGFFLDGVDLVDKLGPFGTQINFLNSEEIHFIFLECGDELVEVGVDFCFAMLSVV